MKFLNLVKQAQEMMANMSKIKEQAKHKTVTVEVGGGVVTVVINGLNELISLKIKPEAIDPNDPALLEDLILSAVNEAIRKATSMVAQDMGALTGKMELPELGDLGELPEK